MTHHHDSYILTYRGDIVEIQLSFTSYCDEVLLYDDNSCPCHHTYIIIIP